MEAETPELSQDIFVLEEGCVVGPLESLGEFQGEFVICVLQMVHFNMVLKF